MYFILMDLSGWSAAMMLKLSMKRSQHQLKWPTDYIKGAPTEPLRLFKLGAKGPLCPSCLRSVDVALKHLNSSTCTCTCIPAPFLCIFCAQIGETLAHGSTNSKFKVMHADMYRQESAFYIYCFLKLEFAEKRITRSPWTFGPRSGSR